MAENETAELNKYKKNELNETFFNSDSSTSDFSKNFSHVSV